uniref:Uncharacterized protein n=1 Tax=Amphimedon queenslandica TaxID=400682 RepID=A0A1X7VTD7_AMPQE
MYPYIYDVLYYTIPKLGKQLLPSVPSVKPGLQAQWNESAPVTHN